MKGKCVAKGVCGERGCCEMGCGERGVMKEVW